MSKSKEEKSKKEGFFSVSTHVLEEIIFDHNQAADAGTLEAEELLAYICLSRGAGRTGSSHWTEHGISKHTGMTFGRAKKACNYLEEHGYIVRNENYQAVKSVTSIVSDNTIFRSRKNSTSEQVSVHHKYILIKRSGKESIFLPNKIVDGNKCGRPFIALEMFCKKIFSNPTTLVSTREARLDAVILFILLNYLVDLEEYGGVPTWIWNRTWQHVRDGGGLGAAMCETGVGDTGFSLNEIQKCEEKFDIGQLSEHFEYIADVEERHIRIQNALESLFHLGFIYEVLQIWSFGRKSKLSTGELEYPLYIFNRTQREAGEPALAHEINNLAFMVYPKEDVFIRGEDFSFYDTFRFISNDQMHYEALSSLRLRYRPHDHDTGVGMRKQAALVEQWLETLSDLKKEVPVC